MTQEERTVGPMLDGRTALITGGANGIGAAITQLFVEHGAQVVVIDNDTSALKELATQFPTITTVEADVLEPDVAHRAAEHQPDILVNNVGHFVRPPVPFVDAPSEEWHQIGEVNLGHALRFTHAVLPGMIERSRGGSIINLTTVEAHRGIPGHVMYSAYKAALRHFTRSLSLEVGRFGIRVNAVAPDLIETPQVPYSDLVPADERRHWPRWAPLGGPGTPADAAGPVLFLASELARYVTGSTVHVGGGSHAAGGWYAKEEGGWTNRPVQA